MGRKCFKLICKVDTLRFASGGGWGHTIMGALCKKFRHWNSDADEDLITEEVFPEYTL